jgi:hypothetical protein
MNGEPVPDLAADLLAKRSGQRLAFVGVEVVHDQVNRLGGRNCIATSQATRANSKADRSGVGEVKWRPALGSTAQKTLAVPHRSYSLFRRASLPGTAGVGGRISACNVTGFSSRQTTGS